MSYKENQVFDKEYCYPGEFLTLNPKEHEMLKDYIRQHIKCRKNINEDISSYGLKHLFEKELVFYVSNSDCKKAMTECGFNAKKQGINWNFNVSKKSVKHIWE